MFIHPRFISKPFHLLLRARFVSSSLSRMTEPVKEAGDQKPTEAKAGPDFSALDFRVGIIKEAKKHPDANSLYVEDVDVGEEAPRTVVSGLVKFVPLEEMQNRKVILLCNLKPVKMRGILSQAMVMCASTPDKVEILDVPEDATPGERVSVEGEIGEPLPVLNPKKKIWEQLSVDIKTDENGVATYKGKPFKVGSKGVVKAKTLCNVPVK